MTELIIKTIKQSCWYQLYDNSHKGDFCAWISIGVVVGLAFLFLAWYIF